MSYKDILVYVDATTGNAACLDVATRLADAHKAHLAALHVVAPPFVPVDVGTGLSPQIVEAQEKFQQEQAEASRKAVDAASARRGHEIEWRLLRGDVGSMAIAHTRHADLAVVSQHGDGSESGSGDDVPEAMLMGGGRPVMVIPRKGSFRTPGETVLVAWNRTREATRAVHDAMPLLERAKSVAVLEVAPEDDSPGFVEGADLVAHLARHGIRAQARPIVSGDVEIGPAILSQAGEVGADLLVMGAYGHSRLREFAFGGVTLHVLRNMAVPTLMSH